MSKQQLYDRRYYEKKKSEKMMSVKSLHKFVYDTTKINVDGYLGLGETKLSTSTLVTHLLTENEGELSILDARDVKKFATSVQKEAEGVRSASKESYTETVSELAEVERMIFELSKRRDVLQDDKKAILAALSVKAVKVVVTTHNKHLITKLERSVSGSSSQGEEILTSKPVAKVGLLASASAFVFGGATTEPAAKKPRTE